MNIYDTLKKANLSKTVYVSFAVYCAEAVIDVFEAKYPNDDRPRKAIEAAKNWIKDPSKANKKAANAAAYAAYAAADAANAASDAATYAAYAAADAANTANAAAYAAYAASDAATYASDAAANAAAADKKVYEIIMRELNRITSINLPESSANKDLIEALEAMFVTAIKCDDKAWAKAIERAGTNRPLDLAFEAIKRAKNK